MVKRFALSAAIAACFASPFISFASDQPAGGVQPAYMLADVTSVEDASTKPLSIAPTVTQAAKTDDSAQTAPNPNLDKETRALTLSDSGSKLHGFGAFSINSQYITPRGLVALKTSPQFQVLLGLSYDLYSGDGFINDFSVNGGVWTDLNTHPNKALVTGADTVAEVDYWVGFGVSFAKNWSFSYSLEAWTFPDLTSAGNEIDPHTEYNMEFKFSFDDTEYLKDFAMHPYVNVFWNFSGSSSPVVAQATAQGRNDNTAYVEFGVGPSYTFKGISDLPITFSFPTYVSVGDSSFWGETASGQRSNWGVFSTGLKISVPLKFIPDSFGHWNAYCGVTYINTINPALTSINEGSGANSNLFLGYAGLGFGF